MATSSAQVYRNEGIVQGQPQAKPADPSDGLHQMSEVVIHTDRVILDPNSPEAVQVPEGSGASTVGVLGPLASVDDVHPEDQIAAGIKKLAAPKK